MFSNLKTSLLLCGCTLVSLFHAGGAVSNADEGMWLFNNLPLKYLKDKYGFEPSEEWADKLMKSCVRFNVGGSASFVSSNGLVLTNHHVAYDTLAKLSDKENNYAEDGFLARTMDAELKAPDLELNQLLKITDVTEQVNSAVTAEMTPGDAAEARSARIGEIESAAKKESGLRSDVVTLYGGGQYHLYQYKKYTDVRLVWAPESSIAFFGGDADNFEYPRYNLDATIFRVYEDGKPAQIEHFLKWSKEGPAENELVFVAGNPGSTSRIYTTDELKYERDKQVPYVLDFIRRREILLQQFGLNGPEMKRIAKDQLLGMQNSRKNYVGQLQGLQDPAIIAAAEETEKKLLIKVSQSKELKDSASAWETIAKLQERKAKSLGRGIKIRTRMFNIAETLVQMATEDQKPSSERFPEYQESSRDSLKQQLFSPAPIYKELEQALLADGIARMCELNGADSEICQKILAGKNPIERGTELVYGSKLDDPEIRKQIAAGGMAAIESSEDPLIKLVLSLDKEIRAERKESDEVGEIDQQAYAKISKVLFEANGDSVYPDATFTLRLAFGTVVGYEEKGKTIPAFTNVDGTFAHEAAREGQQDFVLPESWKAAQEKISGQTKMNFVCTADIIGGNSGSPVVNKDLEIVGLIFDGNIQSLISDYAYNDKQGRSVSVHSSVIREALRHVYDAGDLADQLGK